MRPRLSPAQLGCLRYWSTAAPDRFRIEPPLLESHASLVRRGLVESNPDPENDPPFRLTVAGWQALISHERQIADKLAQGRSEAVESNTGEHEEPTAFAESNALLAVVGLDLDHALEILGEMTRADLESLADSVDVLSTLCGQAIRRWGMKS
jgi:hypothetical protein